MPTKTRKIRKPWGYHLILDASKCNEEAIRSKETIAEFAKKLVEEIKMVAYGSPRIVRFGTGKAKGYTLVQLIETSNITAHFSEETNAVYLDVFSCAQFNPHDAIKVFKEFFNPAYIQTRFIKRSA
jgi:S-adenosylmethionine/arginine decarboxylase-like enzyme